MRRYIITACILLLCLVMLNVTSASQAESPGLLIKGVSWDTTMEEMDVTYLPIYNVEKDPRSEFDPERDAYRNNFSSYLNAEYYCEYNSPSGEDSALFAGFDSDRKLSFIMLTEAFDLGENPGKETISMFEQDFTMMFGDVMHFGDPRTLSSEEAIEWLIRKVGYFTYLPIITEAIGIHYYVPDDKTEAILINMMNSNQDGMYTIEICARKDTGYQDRSIERFASNLQEGMGVKQTDDGKLLLHEKYTLGKTLLSEIDAGELYDHPWTADDVTHYSAKEVFIDSQMVDVEYCFLNNVLSGVKYSRSLQEFSHHKNFLMKTIMNQYAPVDQITNVFVQLYGNPAYESRSGNQNGFEGLTCRWSVNDHYSAYLGYTKGLEIAFMTEEMENRLREIQAIPTVNPDEIEEVTTEPPAVTPQPTATPEISEWYDQSMLDQMDEVGITPWDHAGQSIPASQEEVSTQQSIVEEGDSGFCTIARVEATSWIEGKNDPNAFEPACMIDGNEETCWQFSTKKSKLKETYAYFWFDEACDLDELWIKNGFWKITDGVEQYTRNSRIKELGIAFQYEGSEDWTDKKTYKLKDDKERKDWKIIDLGHHERVTGIRFRVMSIYKGTKNPTDVCVSEVRFKRETAGQKDQASSTNTEEQISMEKADAEDNREAVGLVSSNTNGIVISYHADSASLGDEINIHYQFSDPALITVSVNFR